MKVRFMWYFLGAMLAVAPFLPASPPPPSSPTADKTMPTLAEDRLYKHTPFSTPSKAKVSDWNSSTIEKYLQRTHPGAISSMKKPTPPSASPAAVAAPQATKK